MHNNDILNWENDIKQADKILSKNIDNKIFDEEGKVINKNNEAVGIERKKMAENEKVKGNELMKTKEYDEAIRYYNVSVKYDENEPTTYCNRALAFIRIKSI